MKDGVEYEYPKTMNWEKGSTLELVASWSNITYKVRYNKNDNSGEYIEDDEEYGKPYTLKKPIDLSWTRPHFTFGGWALSSKGNKVYDGGEDYTELDIEKNLTLDLYAICIGDSYTINLNNWNPLGSTNAVKNKTENFVYGKDEKLTNIAIEDYADATGVRYLFSGWAKVGTTDIKYYNMNDADKIYELEGYSTTINLVSVWVKKTNSSQIIFNHNGGFIDGREKVEAIFAYGSNIVYPDRGSLYNK